MGKHGWPFKNADPDWQDADDDTEYPNFHHVKDIYLFADQNYGGKYVCFLICFFLATP
jgi:putative glutathione S-transferase